MYVILCLRQSASGKDVVIPIMGSDEDGEPTDSMAIFEELEDAEGFCKRHILCASSQNIIIDTYTADGFFS